MLWHRGVFQEKGLTTTDPQCNPVALATHSGLKGLILGVANEHSIAWGCAKVLAERGARLVLTCLNEKAHAVVAPLAEQIGATLLICNVEEPGALQQMVTQAVAELGTLDFAIHSIAWAPRSDLMGRVIDSSAEGFGQAMRVSCHSFAELAHWVEPHMPEQGGALLTMSYIGASEAVPNYGLMGPVKAALESLVRYMALELGPRRVRVHAVSPGPVPTRAASGLPQFDALMSRSAEEAPLRRLVHLEEIGRAAAFLVGPDATGMTGETLYVDAGGHAVRC
jgi:enoyl-[acyl-carrier protein] reductase I